MNSHSPLTVLRPLFLALALPVAFAVCQTGSQAAAPELEAKPETSKVEPMTVFETDFRMQPAGLKGSGKAGANGWEIATGADTLYGSVDMVFANPFALTGASKLITTWQVDSLTTADTENPQAQLRFVIAPSPLGKAEPYNLPDVLSVVVSREGSKLRVSVYEKVKAAPGFGAHLYSGETTADALPLAVTLEFGSDSYRLTCDKPLQTTWGSVSGRLAVGRAEAFSHELQAGATLVNTAQSQAKAVLGAFNLSERPRSSQELSLPTECQVFAPFLKEDGVPEADAMKAVPTALELGGKSVEARTAHFDPVTRTLDLAPMLGATGKDLVGRAAFVYIPFELPEGGETTFGFGADWWYAAYLDGQLISETISSEKGNDKWPPGVTDHKVTVKIPSGKHVLAIRFLSGVSSSVLAAGGPLDLLNPPAAPSAAGAVVSGFRPGPPPDRQWKMVWNDEFDGNAIDMQRWKNLQQSPPNIPGFRIKPADENCAVDGQGNLVLRLTRDADGTVRFHRGIISRAFEKAFGYFETRVQFSTQPGWWTSVFLGGSLSTSLLYGRDTFRYSQEFDIFEDFYKPKTKNDISHCYHANTFMETPGDEGDGKGICGGNMLARTKVARVAAGKMVLMEDYGGWHTVALEWSPLGHVFYVDGQETYRQSYKDVPMTTVPIQVTIKSHPNVPRKSKQEGGDMPFYGWLEEATFPDQLVVDYVRVYDQDHGDKTDPQVSVSLEGNSDDLRPGQPATFRVHASDQDGNIKKLYLFSRGYIRAEAEIAAVAPGQAIDHTFTVSNLFDVDNTVIVMAEDNDGLVGMSDPLYMIMYTGREYTGTAYQGKPQAIPGKIIAGHYDEGGQGVAYHVTAGGDPRLTWRPSELRGSTEEVIQAGGVGNPFFVTYRVHIEKGGDYDVELLLNRPDWNKTDQGLDMTNFRDDVIQLDLGKTKLAEWKIRADWDSGKGWRVPKPVGKRRVTLPPGDHQLIVRFDRVDTPETYFCGLEFTPAAEGGPK